MKIDEFEFRNKQGQEIEPTKNQLVIYIKSLHKEIKELEKALELACEEIGRIEAKFGSAYIRANGYLLDYFKTEAKEMLENE